MKSEKFFVYAIFNGNNNLDRLYTDNEGVVEILSRQKENRVLSILRPSTNQYAMLIGGIVVWMDVEEYDIPSFPREKDTYADVPF